MPPFSNRNMAWNRSGEFHPPTDVTWHFPELLLRKTRGCSRISNFSNWSLQRTCMTANVVPTRWESSPRFVPEVLRFYIFRDHLPSLGFHNAPVARHSANQTCHTACKPETEGT